jgi:capsular exopolysaccharide synthesis family protein
MAKKISTAETTAYMQNSVKTLAANIRFASVDNPAKTIVVTSSVPNEGKSTIAIALAEALSTGGCTAILVECDMRRRSLAEMLELRATSGIYSVLAGQASLEQAVLQTSMRGVYLLDAESHIPNPVDILGSRRFQSLVDSLAKTYDYVIFNTPPLSAFVDAAVVGSIADGTLLVVRRNFTKRDEILSAFEQLKKAGASVIGTVLNFCESEKSDYYYYEYYTKGGERRKRKKRHNDSGNELEMPFN